MQLLFWLRPVIAYDVFDWKQFCPFLWNYETTIYYNLVELLNVADLIRSPLFILFILLIFAQRQTKYISYSKSLSSYPSIANR